MNVSITAPPRNHTPGPWDYHMEFIVAPDPGGMHPDIYIAEIAHSDEEGRIATPEQQEANRRLIAAAPEMFDTLVATDLDARHDALSNVLEDPEAGNDELREAAIDLCDALNRHHEARQSALAKVTRGQS